MPGLRGGGSVIGSLIVVLLGWAASASPEQAIRLAALVAGRSHAGRRGELASLARAIIDAAGGLTASRGEIR